MMNQISFIPKRALLSVSDKHVRFDSVAVSILAMIFSEMGKLDV